MNLSAHYAPVKISRALSYGTHSRVLSDGTGVKVRDRLIVVATILYLFRESMSAAILYFLSGSALGAIWFIPDILALIALFAIISDLCHRNRALTAFLFSTLLVEALVVGALVTHSLVAVVAAMKLTIPLAVGFLLREDLIARRDVRWAAITTFAISVAGIFYSSAIGSLPWDGVTFDIGGHETSAKQIVYMYGSRRITGFAGDTHAAAFGVLAPMLFLFLKKRGLRFYLTLPIASYAIYISLSRTTLVVLVVFSLLTILIDFGVLSSKRKLNLLVLTTGVMTVIVPVLIIMWASAADNVSYELKSLLVRGSDSWTRPFDMMPMLAPFAMIHGFGLGGIGHPLSLADLAQYYVPVDNFHLFNLLTYGPVYFWLYFLLFQAVLVSESAAKKVLFVALSIFGFFLLGYGSPVFLLLYSFSFSCVFFNERRIPNTAKSLGTTNKKTVWKRVDVGIPDVQRRGGRLPLHVNRVN